MNGRKGLVLDANILIRAVFGQRVRQILEAYENVASFCSPDVCFQDARIHTKSLGGRGFDPSAGLIHQQTNWRRTRAAKALS